MSWDIETPMMLNNKNLLFLTIWRYVVFLCVYLHQLNVLDNVIVLVGVQKRGGGGGGGYKFTDDT